jgi:hypothetical protein
MADSVRSAIDELESDLITNQVRHLDFIKMLSHFSELAERDRTILGGPDACQRFSEAKKVLCIGRVSVAIRRCQPGRASRASSTGRAGRR